MPPRPDSHDSVPDPELLAALLDDAPDFVVLVDHGHRIRLVNRADMGFAREDLVGVEVESLVGESARSALRSALDTVLGDARSTSLDVFVPRDGRDHLFHVRVQPLEQDGQVAYAVLWVTGIGGRRRTEEELRQSEARFRTLVDHAPDAITILDVDTGRFAMVNRAATELFGRDEAELLQTGPAELSPPSFSQRAFGYIQRALEGETPTFEWTHLYADGAEIPCEVRLVRLPDPHRRLVRGSITDISERKRTEAEQQRMAAQLREAQKMEVVGQLTGGVAHDFNNLLTVILGNLELLNQELEDRPELRAMAEMASVAGRRASALTQRLLAFSRQQALMPVTVDLDELIEDLRALLTRTLGETIEVEIATSDGLWSCQVDPNQLENAVLNLALNARDAMPGGGRLRLVTRNTVVTEAESGALPAGEYVTLRVEDEGEGIEPEVLERVFEPFFTTKEIGRGSGLGLSMVYGFARQSGGDVSIESTPGEGTAVSIHLPRSDSPAEPHEHEQEDEERPQGRGERVLVVEDEDRVRDLMRAFLEQLGYEAIEADCGAAALDLIASGAKPDLLFTDVVLPGGMSGIQLAERARERDPGLRVLFASGYTQDAFRESGGLPAGVDLIEKPYTLSTIARRLRRVLDA